jgi:hypothetical protein
MDSPTLCDSLCSPSRHPSSSALLFGLNLLDRLRRPLVVQPPHPVALFRMLLLSFLLPPRIYRYPRTLYLLHIICTTFHIHIHPAPALRPVRI